MYPIYTNTPWSEGAIILPSSEWAPFRKELITQVNAVQLSRHMATQETLFHPWARFKARSLERWYQFWKENTAAIEALKKDPGLMIAAHNIWHPGGHFSHYPNSCYKKDFPLMNTTTRSLDIGTLALELDFDRRKIHWRAIGPQDTIQKWLINTLETKTAWTKTTGGIMRYANSPLDSVREATFNNNPAGVSLTYFGTASTLFPQDYLYSATQFPSMRRGTPTLQSIADFPSPAPLERVRELSEGQALSVWPQRPVIVFISTGTPEAFSIVEAPPEENKPRRVLTTRIPLPMEVHDEVIALYTILPGVGLVGWLEDNQLWVVDLLQANGSPEPWTVRQSYLQTLFANKNRLLTAPVTDSPYHVRTLLSFASARPGMKLWARGLYDPTFAGLITPLPSNEPSS